MRLPLASIPGLVLLAVATPASVGAEVDFGKIDRHIAKDAAGRKVSERTQIKRHC
jgi:hypothetical protein